MRAYFFFRNREAREDERKGYVEVDADHFARFVARAWEQHWNECVYLIWAKFNCVETKTLLHAEVSSSRAICPELTFQRILHRNLHPLHSFIQRFDADDDFRCCDNLYWTWLVAVVAFAPVLH